MASDDTNHGEIRSRSVFLVLIRFWLVTMLELFPLLVFEFPLEVGRGNFDLLLFVTDDKERVTTFADAKDVSCK